jgi:hypothetical protein
LPEDVGAVLDVVRGAVARQISMKRSGEAA